MIAALTGFLMGFIGSMPISGPVSSLVFHRGLYGRLRDGWAIGLGGALVGGFYCALALHGFTIVRDSTAFVVPLANALGISLLLVLGLYFIFASRANLEDGPAAEPLPSSRIRSFFIGLSIAALNPTPILTWSAFVVILHSFTNLTLQGYATIAFPASVALGTIVWFSILLSLLRRLRGRFPFLILQKLIRGIGVVLVLSSIASIIWLVSGGIGFSP